RQAAKEPIAGSQGFWDRFYLYFLNSSQKTCQPAKLPDFGNNHVLRMGSCKKCQIKVQNMLRLTTEQTKERNINGQSR
ncbi:MAG TPA: hypothetical protein PLK08_05730, partial [Phycisphaerae bacterium]|nr:hypothetical protein [Phycisphaerae bacterium]